MNPTPYEADPRPSAAEELKRNPPARPSRFGGLTPGCWVGPATRWIIGVIAAVLWITPFAVANAAEAVVYTVVDGVGVPEPLSRSTPNPDRGGVIYLDAERGRCGRCHKVASLPDQGWNAKQAGPDLNGVGARMSPAELRLIVVNPRIPRPNGVMPAYFNVSAGEAARRPDARQPLLTAREVEDVVAFLQTLAAE